MSRLFVTGTDTGVGKTLVSALLLSACRQSGRTTQYWKPIQTGDDSDWETVKKLATPKNEPGPPPLFSYAAPMAPLRAAARENKRIALAPIVNQLADHPAQEWLIEGAGGLLVPIAHPDVTMKTLAQTLRADLVLVAATRLGTMNHTLLTLECARAAGLTVRAMVWTGSEDEGLEPFFADWLPEKIAQFRVPQAPGAPDAEWVARLAPQVFPAAALARLFA